MPLPPRVPAAPAPTRAVPSTTALSQTSNNSGAGVRRNLFSASLSRRPTTASSDDTIALGPSDGLSSAYSAGPLQTQHQSLPQQQQFFSTGSSLTSSRLPPSQPLMEPAEAPDEDSSILIRDEHGNYGYEMRAPLSSSHPDSSELEHQDDSHELNMNMDRDLAAMLAEQGVHGVRGRGSSSGAGTMSGAGGAGGGMDVRLIDVFRGSAARSCVDPGELKAVVMASLRRKVAGLDEDRWMFEAESEEIDERY